MPKKTSKTIKKTTAKKTAKKIVKKPVKKTTKKVVKKAVTKKPAVKKVSKAKPVKEEKEVKYYEAVGRRKTAVARVRLFTRGEKEILINEKPYNNITLSRKSCFNILILGLRIFNNCYRFSYSFINLRR